LKIGNFIEFAILNGGRGGGGVGEGTICGGGEDGGGVGGWGICGNPHLISLIVLCREAYSTSSSSPRGGSISGLYSGPVPFLSLNNFPLHVSPNVKVIA